MNKVDIKKVGVLLLIVGVIILVTSINIVNFGNEGITKNKAILTKAIIIHAEDIYGEFEYNRKSILYEYNKKIIYKYTDNYGNIYNATKICESLSYEEISERYLVGETIEITYDKDNPEISILGKINSYVFPHEFSYIIMYLLGYGFIIVGIYFCAQKKYKYFEFGSNREIIFKNNELEFVINVYSSIILIFIIVLSLYFRLYLISIICISLLVIKQIKNYRNNKIQKSLALEVISIEHIDYEREKVIFKDDIGGIYLYYTDFGEEFKKEKNRL